MTKDFPFCDNRARRYCENRAVRTGTLQLSCAANVAAYSAIFDRRSFRAGRIPFRAESIATCSRDTPIRARSTHGADGLHTWIHGRCASDLALEPDARPAPRLGDGVDVNDAWLAADAAVLDVRLMLAATFVDGDESQLSAKRTRKLDGRVQGSPIHGAHPFCARFAVLAVMSGGDREARRRAETEVHSIMHPALRCVRAAGRRDWRFFFGRAAY